MSLRKTKQSAQEYCEATVFQIGQGEYEVIGKYLNQDTYFTVKHSACGHIYSTTLGLFKAGRGQCPRCEEMKNSD